MANKKNVETKKKNTELKDKNSHELKQKKPTQKKKLRLHSHLKVNIPLFQSLMMILPSLAKHAAAESIDNSSDSADQVTVNNVSEKDVTDDHSKAGSSAVVHQEAQTSDSDVNSTLSASHASHGSSAHLVPSHHLSTLSHPQVHYIPSVSMPTISSGSNSQPTHSNAPTTPALPVTFMPEVIKGTYGELHVDANGQYTFVLNPNSPQYILLNQHQPGTDHFALHLSNGSSIIVQIPVTGKQDTPSISGDLTGVVTEDHNIDSQGLLHANGKIDVIDPDQNESSVTPEVISGKYGSLTIDADGHWQYQVDNSLSNVQALTAATSLHESFTIHTKDGTPQTIDMTIGGNDDNAVITGVDAGSVIEDLTTQVQGQLSVTDPDLGEDHFQASQVAGNFGTLIITKDGAWTYDLDNYSPYVQRLAQGSTATDIITVHSADGTAHQVTITINGTNDSAAITNSTGGSPNSFFVVGKSPHLDQVIEDHKLTVSGKLSISDIDAKEAHFSNTDVTGTLGTLHLKDNGAWAYDLDNTNPAVQALGKGATTTDTITVHSADGTPHQVTIIVNGTNDKAVIGGTNSGVVTEESQLHTSGTLTISDVDTGEAHFSNTDAVGALGTLHLKGNGAWTYDLDNTNPKVQALGKGATATDTITIYSADGTPHQVTVTVNGTNDRPTISGTSSGAVIEQGLNTAGTPDATGSLTATDLDKSDTITWAINQPQGQWGTLSIDQHGHWHYQLDNSTSGAADKLAAGEHQSESFWITATDSAGATVPHKIVIDVQGSNDKPIVSAWTQLPAGKEDQPVTIKASDLLTHASDVDSSDVLHVTNLQATHGSLTDNKDGTYTFTPDKDFNGEIRLTYDVVDGHGGSVSTQAKFDLTATPDNAIITDAQTNADLRGVTEDRGYIDTQYQLHYDGRLNIQDPDAGEAQFDPNIGPQTYQGIGYDTKLGGHILLMRDGHYTYTLDNRNIQNLAQGEVKHDSVVIRSADGTTHTIELTVHGTNDVPTINAQSNSVTEGGSVLNGQMVGQDIDTGATLTYSAPQIDGLVVNPDGSYSFNPVHSSYQSLASGITKTLTVPVTVTDEHNASSTQNLSITITGVNNSAVISGVDTGDVHEGHTYTAPDGTMSGGYVDDRSPDHMHGNIGKIWNDEIHTDGHLNIIDPDSGESHAQTGTYQGTHGHVILQSNGDWSYYASIGQDATGRKIDHLGQGESITDTVTVKSADGTTHDIHITIHGDNDRPYCSSEVQLNSGKEDLAQTITTTELLANTVDVDTNDIGKLTIANLHADHGSIQDNTDGTYTFTPTKDYNGPVHFTYDVKDAHGGTTHTGANTTLVATPDKAIISEVTTGRVIEDGPHATHSNGTTTELANGQLQVIDPDSGEDKFQYSQFGESAVHDPFGGMLRIDSAGNWGYSVDNAALQHLAQGQVETVTYRVHSFDGTAYDLNIDIVGTNDAPTVTKVVLSNGTEDINYQMQASQFGFTDVDTGDTLHSIAITDLPPAAQGRFILDGHDITAGQSIASADIAKLQFVPAQDFNGDVQFKFTVNDGHVDSLKATNTLHIDAVNDTATFAGDSGSVNEDTSPHHNLHIAGATTIQDALTCNGHLIVSDADGQGEAALDLNGQHHLTQSGTYGQFVINSSGIWVYAADNNNVAIQDLDNGQTLTDHIEVLSKDGTKHSITVTINGTTDDPVLHSLSDSGVQHSGPIEGNLLTGYGTDQGLSGAATDTDSNAHLVLQDIQIKDPVSGYVAVRPGQPHTMTGIGTLAIEANGHYTFTPEAGFTGKVPSMVYRVGDDGGNPIGDSSQNSLSIEVTPPLQHTPTVTGQTVSTNEDITRTITTSEFGYSDQDGDVLQFVTITSIPSHGLLLLNGNAVTANQQISKADLDAGHLTFTPINNENGANYAQFSFTANDGHQNSASATMIVDVNAVNDAPIVGSSFISSLEDKPHAFTTADFKYSDIDGDALNHITITNVAHGVLTLNGTTVSVGDDVSASDVSSLIFIPTHNYFSSGVSGLGAVQFTANDGHVDSKEGSIFINIASVADPATFSGDSTGVAKEDVTLQASGTLTASDPDGTAGFTAVQGGAGIAGSKGYGHAHIDANGHWTYDLDNKHPVVQQLAQGQTDTETITVQSADGTHHDIVVTITGTNDAPILGVNQTSSTTGTLTETDVDLKDIHTFSVVGSTGQFGSLSVDPNTGDYVYTPNTSITGMSYNSTTNSYHGVDVFEVKVSDGHTEDSKFITFDASGHVTMSPTGGLVISTTVPQQPTVTTTLPSLLMVTNVASTNSVTLDLASTSDSGSSNTDNLTNDTTPTITGHTDIPFSKVTIYDGSTPVGHSVSDASGQYSVAVSSLSEGDHNLSAKALAPSSVLPATSSLLSVHIDTQVHVGIQTNPITADNVINAQESNSSIDITGSVSGDYNAGDIVTLDVNGTQHTGVVDAKGHYSIAVPGSELIADADQKIEASIAVTDTAGNSAHATADVTYQVDTQVSVPTITFENAGADNLYSKAEIARGHANTITATVTPPGDAKIGEHLVVNGQDHVLDAHSLQHGIQIEVHPGSNIQATMTDEHGNTAGSQSFAASAIPEPIIVRPPSGSHQVSGTLGVPPLLPSLTPVPTAQSGWRIHLPNGQYVTSHHGQYGTLTIDPQTGHLHYQEQAQVHTGPHGSASGVGQHEDKFEVALQGTNQDEVVAHVNIQILSHGPGHSGKLTVGTEVVDMTITPIAHSSHPAPPPPPPVLHDEPDMASQADFTVTQSDDSYLDFTQHAHQEPDQKTDHHGAAAYLDALGIQPNASPTTGHDQPADMDIVLAQVDQQDTLDHDQAHLDMSDALEHHDANVNHHQDDEHHHHNDVDGLPDIDPNP
ncbi:VCBS domain-containing protein [Vibrio sp. TMPB1044]|uniref:VCBS domain-containing protein n=1 Tax=Vibrio sp. TMPB1044 TaxID=3051822 RepID=UPI00255C0E81|nr:VCBS domain-containing protein [Vibrio sp. TMPB1044]MDL5027309.1 VCBS domain-containing protein [Vibrio sp. TMPB1044]MDN5207437.1 VCBS domain-containing protein [Vibrio sp. TMPB1044]